MASELGEQRVLGGELNEEMGERSAPSPFGRFRTVSFAQRSTLQFTGNLYSRSLAIDDVDNDGVCRGAGEFLLCPALSFSLGLSLITAW